MRVLIVEDGWGSYILPAVRSLGTDGWTVGLAGPRRSRSASSRWVAQSHRLAAPQDSLTEFARCVAQVIEEGQYDLVFGGDDVELLALSASRERLPAVVPYAEHDVVLNSLDKLKLVETAQRVGLATPETVASTGLDGTCPVPLPVVVKPRLHWVPGSAKGAGRYRARLCIRDTEVAEAVADIVAGGGEAVVQEVVPGSLMAVTALCDKGGNVVAEAQQVAIRTSPRLKTSTRAITTPIDEGLSKRVRSLLAELRWFGIANLQFLRPPGGPARLIDFNGRFYGSLALALGAGLNLPAWWAELSCHNPRNRFMDARARPGVRYQALEEDLRRARTERRGGLLADVLGTLSFAVTATHSTWDPTDLVPTLFRTGQLINDQLRSTMLTLRRQELRQE
jgi:predicted ATP-grasp superfamily ATP-dependent carboligase